MTGDPLDRIANLERVFANGSLTPFVVLAASEMNALVEVARAARELGPILQGERLAAALARLDGPR